LGVKDVVAGERRVLQPERIHELPERQLAEIYRASTYYVEKVFEYPAIAEALIGYPKKPNIELLLGAADALVTALREPCLNAKLVDRDRRFDVRSADSGFPELESREYCTAFIADVTR
jgi:hypothetical protein